jgi:DNA-binding MarR family transcriptional regulator
VELSDRQHAFLALARSLLRLDRTVERVIDATLRAHHDLGLREMFVLSLLERGSLRPGQIATELNLPAPSVSRASERLAGRGWVERRAGPRDRRHVELALTASGRALLERARADLAQALADAWPEVDAGRATDLASGLDALARAAERP